MRFHIDDVFATTLDRFEALLDDPDLYPRMARELPGILRIELLAAEEVDGVLRRRVRYTPDAAHKIPSFARGRITPELLVFVEESVFDRAAHRIDYRVEPNLPPKWRDRFASHGCFTFAPVADGVARRIEGEVEVRVPVLGGIAERLLVEDVKRSFAAEAAVLRRWLGNKSGRDCHPGP